MPRHALAIAALACLLSGPALATQEYILPTLFDVSGVGAGDRLNIRAEPDARARIVGTLAPDATGIEVVEEARGWGRVNVGEATGWVSMRYLSYRTDVWQPGAVPDGFRCLGTEPFWTVEVDRAGGQVRFSQPDGAESRALAAILDSGVFRDPSRAVLAEDLTLVATPALCSDGMSDRLFGLRATLILRDGQPRMLSGCCLIQP